MAGTDRGAPQTTTPAWPSFGEVDRALVPLRSVHAHFEEIVKRVEQAAPHEPGTIENRAAAIRAQRWLRTEGERLLGLADRLNAHVDEGEQPESSPDEAVSERSARTNALEGGLGLVLRNETVADAALARCRVLREEEARP